MDAFYLDEARRRLQVHRDSQLDDKSSRRTSRNKDQPDFTYKEVNQVLEEVVDEGGSAGVIGALLSLGGDVNLFRRKSSNVWKKISGKNQLPERSNILEKAVARGRPDVVSALAAHADQENLDGVLSTSIARADLKVLNILIEYGANPEELHDDSFEYAVLANQVDIVAALVAGPKKPSSRSRSAGLCAAVKKGSLDMMDILVQGGADVNYENASALQRATDSWRPDYITTLVSGPVPPLPGSLDLTVGKTLQMMKDVDSKQGSAIIEICLRAGSSGPRTERLLTKGIPDAVGRKQLHLFNTILKFRSPSGQHEIMALSEAVRTEQEPAIVKLLSYHPTPASLTAGVAQAMQLGDSDSRREIMQILVEGGAKKACLSEALVQVVGWLITDMQYGGGPSELMNRGLLSLILRDGDADVDHNEGEALQMAVKASCTDIVWEIVSKHPSPGTIGVALPLAMQAEDQENREIVVDMLMRQRVDEGVVNNTLVDSVQGGPDNLRITASLLKWANVNHRNGEVFALAIRNMDLNTLRTLLACTPSPQSLHTAVEAANNTVRSDRYLVFEDLLENPSLKRDHLNVALKHVAFEDDPDLELALTLLKNGASAIHEDGACMKNAATTLNLDLLKLLSEYAGPDDTIYSEAFSNLMETGRDWISLEHVELIEFLLEHGATGDSVSKAIIDVVEHLEGDESREDLSRPELSRHLIKLFIAAGGSVNFEDGEVVVKAIEKGDTELVRLLLSHDATTETSSRAFSSAILAGHSEELLLDIIDIFAEDSSAAPEIDTSEPGLPPPIFLCLEAYPDSVNLLRRLVMLGCDLESTVTYQVYHAERNEEDSQLAPVGPELVTVLTWALANQEVAFDMPILVSMAQLGANASYATPDSQTTPLIIATKIGHLEAVELLLEAGAKPSSKDRYGRSALFYASGSGDVDIVATILHSKPSKNDGSLHEAARSFHAPVMELLLKAGHDADYRSTKHGGRTALGEMALRGRVSEDVAKTEESVDLLKDAGSDPMVKVDGKSVIFLALDNKNPEPVVRVLLDRILWKTLNSDGNIYQEGNYHYSPSMYLQKGVSKGGVSMKLTQALKDHGAVDRYYASMEQTQPYDAVGLPDDIAEFEKLRRAREIRIQREEEEHEIRQRRENDLAINKVLIADLQHDTVVRHGDELTEQKMRNRQLEHSQNIQNDVESHNLDVAKHYAAAEARSKAKWLTHQNQIAINKQAWEAEREKKWMSHEDSRDMLLENRTADLDHRRIEHQDDQARQAEIWEADRQRRWLAHQDDRDRLLDSRTLDREHKMLTHADDSKIRAEKRVADLEHRRIAYQTTREQRLLTNQDDLDRSRQAHTLKLSSMTERKQLEGAIRDQQHTQELAHRQNAFQQHAAQIQTAGAIHLQIRSARHAMQMDHKAKQLSHQALEQDQSRSHQRQLDAQKRDHKVLRNQEKLESLRARDAQTVGTRRLLAQHSNEAGQAKVGQLRQVHDMRMAQMDSERKNMAGQVNLQEWHGWKSGQGLSQGSGRAVQGGARKVIKGPEIEEVDD